MSHTDIDYIEEDIDNLPANISQQMHIIGNTFFLATNNIRGLCEPTKQTQLINFIESNNIDIMGISETKLTSRTAEFILKNYDDYLSWWNCDDSNQAGSGVGLIMKKHIAQYVQSVKGFKGQLIYTDLFMKG